MLAERYGDHTRCTVAMFKMGMGVRRTRTYDLVVVGAGIWGMSAARSAVMEFGVPSVLLVEAASWPGSENTSRSGAILSDIVVHDRDAALVERSRFLYGELGRRFKDESILRTVGQCILAPDTYMSTLMTWLERLQGRGVKADIFGGRDLRRRFPDLDRITDDTAGLVLPGGAVLNPSAWTGFALKEAQEHGLHVALDTAAQRIDRSGSHLVIDLGEERVSATRVLVASGVWTAKILRRSGLDIAFKPYRTQVASVELHRAAVLPVISTFTDENYLSPEGPNSIMLGDGTEYVESDPDVYRTRGDGEFEASVAMWFMGKSSLGEHAAIRRSWAGLCGATPDQRPLVGEVAEGVFCACGDNGFGVMRGPGMGELAAAVALDLAQAPDLAPSRFPSTEFEIHSGASLNHRPQDA